MAATINIAQPTLFTPIAPKGMVSYIARISPGDAKLLMDMNKKNREISKSIISKYCADMQNGIWKDSASQIQISTDGVLLNGQHRLRAIIDTNTAQLLTVTEGLEPECFSVLDVGRGRTPGDALSILEIKNFKVCAAMIRFWMTWRAGINPHDMEKYRPYGGKGLTTNTKIKAGSKAHQIYEIMEFANKHPNLEHLGCLAKNYSSRFKKLSASLIGAILIQADIHGSETRNMAEDFFEKLCSGVGLAEKDPILKLRNKIMEWVETHEWGSMGLGYKLQVLMMVWNAWIDGKKIDRFRVIVDKPQDMNPVKILSKEAA